MRISFDPLWKTLVDKKLSKSELAAKAGLSRSTLYQLSKNETVTLDTIVKICEVLKWQISDVVEITT